FRLRRVAVLPHPVHAPYPTPSMSHIGAVQHPPRRDSHLIKRGTERPMTPEMILTNARVLTMDPARPRAEAVAVAGGRIAAVGSRAEVEALAGPATEVID